MQLCRVFYNAAIKYEKEHVHEKNHCICNGYLHLSVGWLRYSYTRIITDGAGRQTEVPETVRSIVCVGVGALRYTCYVGAQDLVIGV